MQASLCRGGEQETGRAFQPAHCPSAYPPAASSSHLPSITHPPAPVGARATAVRLPYNAAVSISTPTDFADLPLDGVGPAEGLAPIKDRLTTTVFLTALFHGIVIIGISFAVPPISMPTQAPTLEVVLLSHPDAPGGPDNPQAQYISQSSQTGSGTTTEAVRASAARSSPVPAVQDGEANGNGATYKDNIAGTDTDDLLSSREDKAASFRNGVAETAAAAEIPAALSPGDASPILSNASDDTLQLRGKPRTLEATPDTRESRIAPYLDAWKRKIEYIGTLNYPNAARSRKITRNPVLEVTIHADGRLAQSSVRRSSGFKDVDKSAMAILKLAAPFDPFPAELKQQYDELHFAYEWQFLGHKMQVVR